MSCRGANDLYVHWPRTRHWHHLTRTDAYSHVLEASDRRPGIPKGLAADHSCPCASPSTRQPDVTAADVLTIIEEFDRLGRAEFFSKYGYRESHSYFLHHGGRFYDSKAIVGVTHQVRHGQPLIPEDFSGGDATVAALLRRWASSCPNPTHRGPWVRSRFPVLPRGVGLCLSTA